MADGEKEKEARDQRARELRDRIRRIDAGISDNSPKTPREITDESARRAEEKARAEREQSE